MQKMILKPTVLFSVSCVEECSGLSSKDHELLTVLKETSNRSVNKWMSCNDRSTEGTVLAYSTVQFITLLGNNP